MDKQLALALFPKELKQLNNFYRPVNQQAFQAVESVLAGELLHLHLAGEQGSGKSHLLQAVSDAAQKQGLNALYLPLDTLIQHDIALLAGAEQADLLCFDNIDCLQASPTWRQAIFDLFNQHRLIDGKPWITASEQKLGVLDTGLPDLNSRFTLAAQILLDKQITIEEGEQALIWFAAHKNFNLAEDMAQYIMARIPRDIEAVIAIINRLDQSLWGKKTPLTKNIIRQLIEIE